MNYIDLLSKENINCLIHFTNINNLKSILENGILSVDYMKKNNISYVCSDKNRFDNQLDLISLSFNSINHKMLYKKIHQNVTELNIWIALVLDLELLEDDNLKCYFCSKNASSRDINNILKYDKNSLANIDALKNMIQSSDLQKEVLVEGIISPKYIRKIVVTNMNDYSLVSYILKTINSDIKVIYNKDFYTNYGGSDV